MKDEFSVEWRDAQPDATNDFDGANRSITAWVSSRRSRRCARQGPVFDAVYAGAVFAGGLC